MLDIKLIRENPKLVQDAMVTKGVKTNITELLVLDDARRKLQSICDELRAKQKTFTADTRDEAKATKIQLKEAEERLEHASTLLEQHLGELPNLPRPDVKIGKDESENEVLRVVGDIPKFTFKPKDYLELAKLHDLIDIERAGKVSGSRFGYLKREAALLEFALVQYGYSILLKHGFIPLVPPVFINEKAMKAMGYLEHGGEEETYHFEKDGLYLVGTSEQSIGPMHMDEVLDLKNLPLRYVGFSTCFRREAGSYGKDTRGILRVHQFDKLEMVVYTTPDKSDEEHEFLLSLEEEMMKGLKLPYHVIKMCTADLGDPAARKYDIEAWIPSEQKYRETHSCSTTTDFQSRRLNIKYKTREGKNELVHILNGTVTSTNRPIIAILENYQQADGSVLIPEILQPYMFGIKKIGKP